MDTNVVTYGSAVDVESALKSHDESDPSVFTGSIKMKETNSSFMFSFVNAKTLSYILKVAKEYGTEVTVEIFQHDETTEALQRQDFAGCDI